MKKYSIVLIKAAWHDEIVSQCEKGFLENLPDNFEVKVIKVPGSLEIPLVAKKMAQTRKHDCICCAGFVTDGDIYKHEFVAHAILQGIMNVQLETEVPILSAVLTPKETFAEDGSNPKQYDFFFKHMETKGKELAESCFATVQGLEKLKE